MPEGQLRLVSLAILGGPLHGRRHSPDEVVAEILIGSDPDCHLVVEIPGISPIHAKLWADLNECTVYDTSAPRGVYVNTERVEEKARITAGDVVWLGPPQEPGSVCVQLQFEPWVEMLPGLPAEGEGAEDAVVVEGDAASTLAVTPDMIPAEAPPEPEPQAEVIEEAKSFQAESVLADPLDTPTVVEPRAAAAVGEDPFFVGEDAAGGLSSAPAPLPPSEEEADARAPETPGPAAEDWAIAEASVAEPDPAAAPAADEFFVAGEPEAPAAEEPMFIEADPVLEASVVEPLAPEAPAPFFELPPLEPTAPPPPAPAPPPPPPVPAPAKAAASTPLVSRRWCRCGSTPRFACAL